MSASKKKRTFEESYKRSLDTQGFRKIWNYFLDLIKTEKFQKEVEKIRVIGKEGSSEERAELGHRIILMANNYGLDGYEWEDALRSYIFFNKIVKPEGVDLCKITNIPDLEDLLNETQEELISPHKHYLENYNASMNLLNNFPIVILVNPNASLRDIIDFVTKNYDLQIAVLQKAYKRTNKEMGVGVGLGKSKRKDNDILERNDFIYEHKHLPRRRVMELLTEKYGADKTLDVGYIGKIISLEKRKRKEL